MRVTSSCSMCLPFFLTGLRAAGCHVYGFMEVARVVRCCLLRAFPGFPLMEVIVPSWSVNVICFLCFFCHVCMPSGYALSRVFVCVLHPYGFPDIEHEGVIGNVSTSAVVIVKHLKNRNSVASPDRAHKNRYAIFMGTRRTTCTVCGDAPCYVFLSIQLYVALCRSAWRG